MRTFSVFAALLLLAGCNDSKETKKTPTPSAQPASQSVSTPAPSVPETTEIIPEPSSEPAVVPVSEAMNAAATSAPQLTHKPETSPALLFQKCAACHGNHGEKSALNQSAVIGEWDSKRIANTIIGYQDGTYGGAMKTLMQNQVKDLSRVQVEALSEYISNLYVKTH